MDVISSYDDESKELIIFGRRVCLDPDWVRGIESDVRGGEGPYELPPSRGWPCSVENIKLFSKPRGAQ